MFSSLLSLAFSAALFGSAAQAASIPSNLQTFYNSVKSGGGCSNNISGFNSGSGTSTRYCFSSSASSTGTIMWVGSSKGLADMDVDCDGANNSAGDCANDPSGQSETAFKDTVAKYGISDLNANVHGYVVLGNTAFDPQSKGIDPLSVVAVVCNNQLLYGIWGDTNGGSTTGESSIALAQACFPNEGLTGDNGHGDNDVLYIAFAGSEADTNASVNWKASNFAAFEASLQTIGNSLVSKIGSGGSTPTTSSGGSTPTCSWEGHCAGASCTTENDCSDVLICVNGKCASG